MGLKKLKIIGNGDAFGSGGRYHTCFYLESGQTKFLVDLGATSIHNLQASLNLNSIDLILLSHFHGDHFGGVPFFFLNSAFSLNRHQKLTIVGPEGCKERILSLTEMLYPGIGKKLKSLEVNFTEYTPEQSLRFRDLEIMALPALHSDEARSHSLQVSCDKAKFAYSGDTEWSDDLYRISSGADYFICECTYYSTRREGHINYLDLDRKLNDISAKRILLTHLGDEMLDKENRAKVRVEYAEENKEYKF